METDPSVMAPTSPAPPSPHLFPLPALLSGPLSKCHPSRGMFPCQTVCVPPGNGPVSLYHTSSSLQIIHLTPCYPLGLALCVAHNRRPCVREV